MGDSDGLDCLNEPLPVGIIDESSDDIITVEDGTMQPTTSSSSNLLNDTKNYNSNEVEATKIRNPFVSHHWLKRNPSALKSKKYSHLKRKVVPSKKISGECTSNELAELKVQQAKEKHTVEMRILQLEYDEMKAKLKLAKLKCDTEKIKIKKRSNEEIRYKRKGFHSSNSDERSTTNDSGSESDVSLFDLCY